MAHARVPRKRRTKAEIAKAQKRAEASRKANLKKRHHMTPEQYDALLAFQGGTCYMCSARGVRRALQVDHDHTYARENCDHPHDQSCHNCWRGLLCGTHNNMLGRAARDDRHVFELAIRYLVLPPAQEWQGR